MEQVAEGQGGRAAGWQGGRRQGWAGGLGAGGMAVGWRLAAWWHGGTVHGAWMWIYRFR